MPIFVETVGYHQEDNDLVIPDHSHRIGCQACVKACPWHVPSFSKDEKKVYKCDGCQARLKKGEVPACLAACPTGVIEFGDIDELRAKYPEAQRAAGVAWAKKVFGYPDPALTDAHMVILPLVSSTGK